MLKSGMGLIQQPDTLSCIVKLLEQSDRLRSASLVSKGFRTAADSATTDICVKIAQNEGQQEKLDSFTSWIQRAGIASKICNMSLTVRQQSYYSDPYVPAIPWISMGNLASLLLSNVSMNAADLTHLGNRLTKLELQTAGTTSSLLPHLTILTNLRQLSLLGGKQQRSDYYKAIGSTLVQLTCLKLQNCDMDDDTLAALLPDLSQLCHLEIEQQSQPDKYQLGQLAALIEPLTTLTKLTPKGCSSLSSEVSLTGMRHIEDLKLCINLEDARPLTALTSLTHLKMADWGCSDASIAKGFLQVLPQLPQLQYLELDHLDFAKLKLPPSAFSAIPQITRLARLDLVECELPKGAASKGLFAKAKCFAQLKHLYIKNVFSYFWCDDEAYRYRKSPNPNLVSAADLKRVAAACPNLISLDFNIPICVGMSAGLTALAKLKHLSHFKWCVDTEYSRVDDGLADALDKVKSRWPNIKHESPEWPYTCGGNDPSLAHIIDFK